MSNKTSRRLQADWPTYLSYDKSNGKIANFYSNIDGVIRKKGSIFSEKRQIDIFLLAMAIGRDMNSREPIKSRSNSIRRDALTEREVWLVCCTALSEKVTDLDMLADPDKMIKICEEYANAGIGTLMRLEEQLGSDSKPYEEFLEKAINASSNEVT